MSNQSTKIYSLVIINHCFIRRQDITHSVRKAKDSRADILAELRDRNVMVRNLLDLMGLEHVKDTLVGDELVRGISGGQKKRVTVCEKFLAWSRVCLMDEISTGLDSSTT